MKRVTEVTEDYCSFEIAKLLKEKGFDAEHVGCKDGIYNTDGGVDYDDLLNSELLNTEYVAIRPSQSLAMKWLREVHNILIIINGYSLGWYYNIYDTSWNYIGGCKPIFVVDNDVSLKKSVTSSTYEKACEAAIKYCLENFI